MTKTETLTEAAYGRGCLGRSASDEPVFVLGTVTRTPRSRGSSISRWLTSRRIRL